MPFSSGNALRASIVLLLCLLGITLLYFALPPLPYRPGPTLHALHADTPSIDYELTTTGLHVDWQAGGPDFDPRGKCLEDFFGKGFILLIKRQTNGGYVRFLYHKGRRLLYRIDKDKAGKKARIGLPYGPVLGHWLTSTKFNARYRIADPAYKGGKAVKVPNAKGGKDTKVFQYGQAVSKRRMLFHRELFRETHITPRQCPEWWDIFNFMP